MSVLQGSTNLLKLLSLVSKPLHTVFKTWILWELKKRGFPEGAP